jgi:WXG100 family type VII secretion target
MTDYSKMNHQTLYNYAHSGSPDAMNNTATAWQNHSQALEQATSELQTNLTAIQSQWEGAAADAYFQQSQDVATKMQTHADNAANTSTAVTNTANALTWARQNMPDPPSWLEQQTANIDSNIVTGAIGFLTTDGAATVASEMAKHDIANKHQQAISTMTQLAAAYTSAKSQLPTAAFVHKDPSDGQGNGNGSSSSGGSPPVMPVPIYPMSSAGVGGGIGSGYPGDTGSGHLGSGGTSRVGVSGGSGSGVGGGSTGGGPAIKVPSFTNPGGETFTQGTGAAGGTSAGGVSGSSNSFGLPAESSVGFSGGAGQYGGGIGSGGAAGLGALGAGAGALGAGEFGSGEGGSYGGVGGYGSRKFGTGTGATDLGAGEGSGIWGGEGSAGGAGSRYGSKTVAAGEGEVATGGAADAQGQPGMMGGMGGRGGAGGSGEERGNRAGFLRQDPDYWYGDKQAAPPGGVIE